MLRNTESIESAANPKETEGEVSGDNVVGDLVSGGEAINPTK